MTYVRVVAAYLDDSLSSSSGVIRPPLAIAFDLKHHISDS